MKNEKFIFKNIPLEVFKNANPNKSPIIFVHGNSMSSKIWKKQFESNLSNNYFLLAFDMTGFGDSGHSKKPDEDYNIFDLSEALLAVILHYKLSNYILVGHSLGGNIILQSLPKLKNCKGILTIGTPTISTAADMANMFLPNAALSMLFQKDYVEENLNSLQDAFFINHLEAPDFFKPDLRKADGMVRQTITANVGESKFINEVEELKKQSIKVAFTSGIQEKAVNNNYFNTLDASLMWKGKLHLIKDSAHCPQWENANEFNDLLELFIRDVKD
jgi:pimeloyl-ACP methyl ester carboxylesterase